MNPSVSEFRSRIKDVYPRACAGDISAVEELRDIMAQKDSARTCACGCGKPLIKGRIYASRMCVQVDRRKRKLAEDSERLCECGCGKPLGGNIRFASRHCFKKPRQAKFCACGCGRELTYRQHGNKYATKYCASVGRRKPVLFCECGCGRILVNRQTRFASIECHCAVRYPNKSVDVRLRAVL